MSETKKYSYEAMCRYLVEDENGEAVPFLYNDGKVLAHKDYSVPYEFLPDSSPEPWDYSSQHGDSPLSEYPFYRSRISSLVDPSKAYDGTEALWQEAKSKAVFVEYYIQGIERTWGDHGGFVGKKPLDSPLVLLRIPVTHGKNGRTTIQWKKAVDGNGQSVEIRSSVAPSNRSIGSKNKSMRLFFDEECPGAFFEQPDKAEKLALHFERSMGWREHHWSLSTLAENIKYFGTWETDTLLAKMVEGGNAAEGASFTEFHFSQPDEASEDRGEKKLTAAPAGKKQIWCEYPTRYGWPMGNQFLSVELVYPQGEDSLDIFDLIKQFRRTCYSLIKEDRSRFAGCFSYVRVTQRETTSEDEVGAHVYYLPKITPEFAKEWGYPRDKWYEYPCIYQ